MRIVLDIVCHDCAHTQEAEALDPVVNGPVLESYLVGSAGFHCDACDSMNVEHLGWRKVRHLSLVKS